MPRALGAATAADDLKAWRMVICRHRCEMNPGFPGGAEAFAAAAAAAAAAGARERYHQAVTVAVHEHSACSLARRVAAPGGYHSPEVAAAGDSDLALHATRRRCVLPSPPHRRSLGCPNDGQNESSGGAYHPLLTAWQLQVARARRRAYIKDRTTQFYERFR